MEREALGIRQVIDEGLQKPEQTAKIIARMLVRDIWAQVHKHSTRNHWELSPLEQVALVALKLEGKCKQIARQQVQKSFIPSIKLILEEHISGNINVAVSAELQKMIAQAVLELIAVGVSRKGHHELAHGIHNEPNALHLLKNPTRLLLLDHGIIHGNPREASSDNKKSALWTGHRTDKKFRKKGAGDTNIYVEVTPNKKLVPILEGNRIIAGITDELIVFTDTTISFHSAPQLPGNSNEGFTAPLEFSTPNTIGNFQNISHKSVATFVGWNGYILRGTVGAEVQKEEKQVIVCIRTKKGKNSESFASNGKIYTLDNTILVIEEGGIYVLTKTGKQKLTISVEKIIGVRKFENQKESIYMIADGKKQKLFMEEDDAVFQVTRAEEEKFFQETK